jgi:hypothetical protein
MGNQDLNNSSSRSRSDRCAAINEVDVDWRAAARIYPHARPGWGQQAGRSARAGVNGGGRDARYIDHTSLKPEATRDEINQLCKEARANSFASVCVNPTWVKECASSFMVPR